MGTLKTILCDRRAYFHFNLCIFSVSVEIVLQLFKRTDFIMKVLLRSFRIKIRLFIVFGTCFGSQRFTECPASSI